MRGVHPAPPGSAGTVAVAHELGYDHVMPGAYVQHSTESNNPQALPVTCEAAELVFSSPGQPGSKIWFGIPSLVHRELHYLSKASTFPGLLVFSGHHRGARAGKLSQMADGTLSSWGIGGAR